MRKDNVKQLSPSQRGLVTSLTKRLGAICGMRAVVLGGSHARGRARPDSDIDLGLYYSERDPFSIQSLRELAQELNDTPSPVLTSFYEWGPWINGGAWLTIDGQRIDLLYRSLEHVERVIAEAECGRYEIHYLQQPPFGFFSGTYLGETAVSIPLLDPESRLEPLKRRVAVYPEAFRRAVVQDFLFMAEFTLTAFAPKFAARSDSYGTASCLSRAANELVLALFALNRKYPINDKTALLEITDFELVPPEFASRVQNTFAHLGASPADLLAAVQTMTQLLRDAINLAGGLYQTRYVLPKCEEATGED
jgi:predicted nucleotidyltransferase